MQHDVDWMKDDMWTRERNQVKLVLVGHYENNTLAENIVIVCSLVESTISETEQI